MRDEELRSPAPSPTKNRAGARWPCKADDLKLESRRHTLARTIKQTRMAVAVVVPQHHRRKRPSCLRLLCVNYAIRTPLRVGARLWVLLVVIHRV